MAARQAPSEWPIGLTPPPSTGNARVLFSSACSLAIRVSPVSNTDDQYNERIVLHFVQHAVLADANSPQAPQLPLQRIASERVLRQPVNGLNNPLAGRLCESKYSVNPSLG